MTAVLTLKYWSLESVKMAPNLTLMQSRAHVLFNFLLVCYLTLYGIFQKHFQTERHIFETFGSCRTSFFFFLSTIISQFFLELAKIWRGGF